MVHELNLSDFLIFIPLLLLSLSVHEFAHGYVADRLGDPTPRLFGRLSLNPLAHLDPIGTLVLLFTRRFGWAKPVPINPRNFSDPAKDTLLVSLAGPLSNISLAVILSLPFRFNLIKTYSLLVPLLVNGIYLNIGLAIFNLIPIPPLDGSKILAGLLPARYSYQLGIFERYGSVILAFLMFTGGLSKIISPLVNLVFNYIVGL
ncbi:MAG TPA: site-2 protease family protein [Clostridia bacterium]|jgi:Zn-dependent protease|nr:site-2 protease family protein [Clostridia bacterium]